MARQLGPASVWAVQRIERYQREDSADRPGNCNLHPTCSNYGLEQFQTRPFLVAGLRTFARMVRCAAASRR